MNIIFDNIIFSLQKSGGGSVYWYELIKRFQKTNNKIIFIEEDHKSNNILRENLEIIESKSSSCLSLKINRFLPVLKKISKKTIFHSSYYRVLLSKNVINITTIHDFTPEYFFHGLSKKINHIQKENAIRNSDGIICISENTKKDLLKFHPKSNTKNIKVIHNGVSDSFFKIETISALIADENDDEIKTVLGKKYILYVGHRTSYKNFNIAVETMQSFKDKYHFVIVGEPLSKTEEKIMLGYLSENDFTVLSGKNNVILNMLYNQAFCLLYPSSYEGFGIPILEAMKAGCPVVTTNKSSIPEVAGNAAIMIENISVANFSKGIESLSDNDFRNNHIQEGYLQANKFSWDKSFNEVMKFYQELYDKK